MHIFGNILSAHFRGVSECFREVRAYFRGVSAYLRGVSAYFRGVSAYFREVSAYFRAGRPKALLGAHFWPGAPRRSLDGQPNRNLEHLSSHGFYTALEPPPAPAYSVICCCTDPQGQKRKISPKTEVFGRTSLRTSGQKLRSQALQILEKQAFWHGRAPRTSTTKKKLRSEKLRADFSFPTRGINPGKTRNFSLPCPSLLFASFSLELRSAPPPPQGHPNPWDPEPRKSPKRSQVRKKSPERVPQSGTPRVLKECGPRSLKRI